MRTTLTIDDAIMAELRKRAFESNKSFKEVVNETLSKGLLDPTSKPGRKRSYKQRTLTSGGPMPGINLVKANQLAGELEDEEILRKMELRK